MHQLWLDVARTNLAIHAGEHGIPPAFPSMPAGHITTLERYNELQRQVQGQGWGV